MRTLTIKGTRGNTITLKRPENQKDVDKLIAQEKDGNFDDRESFGDDPGAWEKKGDKK